MTCVECGERAEYWTCCGGPVDDSSGTGCHHDDEGGEPLCEQCGVANGYWREGDE